MRRTVAIDLVAFAIIVIVLPIAVILWPNLAAAATAGGLVAALAGRYREHLPRWYIGLLGTALTGYAFMGRGFAYLGAPPLYVGEIVLAVGLLSLALTGGLVPAFRTPVAWLLLLFMIVGGAATIPYVGDYGLDALRDAAVWGYAVFAFIVAAFVVKSNGLPSISVAYARVLPIFLAWIPLGRITSRLSPGIIPNVPGSDISLVHLKSGDLGVHLAGALAFLVLGLHNVGTRRRAAHGREWLLWTLWFVSFGLIFNNRGGILTVLVVSATLLLLRPSGRWGKHVFIAVLAFALLVGFDIRIPVSPTRTISIETLVASVESVVGETGEMAFDGTREWRLTWWREIIAYTVFGDYFWRGKGYGINLADDDGFQVTADHSLRSPHNGHLTVLARSGMPGALAWFLLQVSFAALLLAAYFRSRHSGHHEWSRINLWLFCYWLAFMVNGTFDVFLEGPQGGIWFWSIFGLGIAALVLQRRGSPQENLSGVRLQ